MGRITYEVKLEIIEQHERGKTIKTILRELNDRGHVLSRGQVRYAIDQYICGYFVPGQTVQPTRMKTKICQRDVDVVKNSLSANVNQSSRDLHKELMKDGADISLSTTKQIIKEAGYTNSNPRYAHMVKAANTEPRVTFCRNLIERNDDLADIIFSDESSVQLHNNKTTSYRLINSRNAVIPKPKHPLKVHVWAGISRRGPTPILIFDGIMDSHFFTKNILQETLLPFIRRVYPDGHRFQQDNDPKHRSHLARNFMRDNGINWWDVWPSESPDLNPIEMVWNQLKRAIAKIEPRTKDELVDAITSFWTSSMTANVCNRYIDHVFKVAPTCIVMNGRATGDVPRKLFPETSQGKSFHYFSEKLSTQEFENRIRELGL